ncbi:MAG TPA: hypothetical protein VFV89_10060 [Nocardioides sp.]|uniref:hypothetical protein n=1 Tax=Nocardioides sp. TaxID=35761 RepID=UPI002E340DED|nr:hypothetical protein [Nocardioides sp.]HEX5088142.1 hypothetical protein [Nocardioides sp.]
MTTTTLDATTGTSWRDDAAAAARTLSVLTLVGAACGGFAVGILSRLAMFLLARLNPAASGVTSDDGFVMGRFTLSGSLQLAGVGLQLGVAGAAFYVALRGLLTGPPWFRLLSISLGPAVVAGAMAVHTDGIDFHLLEPTWLAVALFIAVPGVYAALLHVIGERALERWQPGRLLLGLGLAPWVLLLPVTLLLAAGFAVHRRLRRGSGGPAFLASPWPARTLRAGLAVLFVLALIDLRNDVIALS